MSTADTDHSNIEKAFTLRAREPFTITFPKLDATAPDTKVDPEIGNQEKMFQLRTIFLETPVTNEFVWIPQALEAFLRARRSDHLPDFGTMQAVQIDPAGEKVKMLTSGEIEAGFEVTFQDLTNYSIELVLNQMDTEHEISEIDYTPEMRAVVEALPPSAKYRWEMITRVAKHIHGGRDRFLGSPLRINAVGRDMLFGNPEGLGIFLDNGVDDRFSLLKITGKEVPLTEREQKLFELSTAAYDAAKVDPKIKEFLEGLNDLGELCRELYSMDVVPGWRAKIRERVMKAVGEKKFPKVYELVQLLLQKMNNQSKKSDLPRRVAIEVYRQKGKYSESAPFEAKLPSELMDEIRQGGQEEYEILLALSRLAKENEEMFMEIIESAKRKPVKALTPHIESLERKNRVRRVGRASAVLEKARTEELTVGLDKKLLRG